MSDDAQDGENPDHLPRHPPNDANEDDFGKFMVARGIPDTCVICKGGVQIIQHARGLIPADVTIDFPPDLLSTSFSYMFRTRCTNCGNIQNYDRSEVVRWKIENT